MAIQKAKFLASVWVGFCVAGICIGCASTKPKVETPSWVDSPPQSTASNYYIGRAEETKTRRDAVTIARERALAKIPRQFEVQVEGSIEIQETQSARNGYAYQVDKATRTKTRPVDLKEFEVVKKKVIERDSKWRAWVLVEVPNRELERIRRSILQKTALHISCNPEKLCPSRFESDFRAIASEDYGLSITPGQLRRPPTPDRFSEIAQKYDAAYLLSIRINTTETKEIDGEHYAIMELQWNRYDLDEKKTLQTRSIGPVEGAHFSPKEAVRDGTEILLQKLRK